MEENQRIILTKRLLKEGLLRLLKVKNIDKINISELCREAGINRATFYRHYEFPHDVLLDIEADFVKELYAMTGKPKSMQEAKRFLEIMCTYLYEHSDMVKLFIRCNSDTDFARLLDEFYRNLFKFTEEFRGFNNLDADSLRLISTYVAGGGYFLLRQWLMEDISKTPDEIASLVFHFFSRR